MSADNWTTCPRCKKRAEAEKADRMREAEKAYGKVSAVVYGGLISVAAQPILAKDSLREDYHIGIDGGQFAVSYRARCQDCDFEFDHRFTQDLSRLITRKKTDGDY